MEIQKKKDTDMTEGVIWKQLLWFALPLMVGNVFQQFYNTVDSIVVGNFVGKEALAAVGSVGSIINSVIGFFGGLATGASVVIAQTMGRKRKGQYCSPYHLLLHIGPVCGVYYCGDLGNTIFAAFYEHA